jgi:hypothetical protein
VELIYLVIRDAALRSSLTAWLGLSGHPIVALQDMSSLAARAPSVNHLYVIDGELLSAERESWDSELDPMCASARCVVLIQGEDALHGALVLANRRTALPAIQMTIARMEGRHIDG